MTLRDLKTGDWFEFADRPVGRFVREYCYYGNGWFGRPYSGGPWHTRESPRVFLLSLEHEANLRAEFADCE